MSGKTARGARWVGVPGLWERANASIGGDSEYTSADRNGDLSDGVAGPEEEESRVLPFDLPSEGVPSA